MSSQQIIDQLAARRAARDAEFNRHRDALDKAKLIDTTAIAKARNAPLAPITRATVPVITATSMADFLDKYRNAGPATIDLGNTVLEFGGSQFVMDKANVKVDGGELRFNRPGGNATVPEKNCYGIVLAAPGAGLGSRTKIRSNRGVVWTDNSGCSGFTFSADVQSGSAPKYYTPALWSGVGAVGWSIVNAYFHDSQGSDRTLELWGAANLDYSNNRFDNVKDGGHLMENGGNIRMVSNWFDRLGRMGIEVQGESRVNGFLYADNVVNSFVNRYFDCELISMCAVNMTGVVIERNYANSRGTGWANDLQGQGKRLGIAIEAMTADNGCTVQDNTVGGPDPFACIVAAGSLNMLCQRNQVYGVPTVWGDYVSEPGTRGMGTIKDGGGNVRHPASEAMPEPIGGNGGETPTMQLTATPKPGANGGGAFDFAWKQLPALAKRVKVFGAATGDPQNQNNDKTTHAGPPAAWDATGDGGATSDGWHPGWHFDFTAIALDAAGKELARSAVVNAQATGNPATEPWPPSTTPPPPTDEVASITVTMKSGKQSVFTKQTAPQ